MSTLGSALAAGMLSGVLLGACSSEFGGVHGVVISDGDGDGGGSDVSVTPSGDAGKDLEIDTEKMDAVLATLRPPARDDGDATWRKACVEDCLLHDDPEELRSFLLEVFTDEAPLRVHAASNELWALRTTADSN